MRDPDPLPLTALRYAAGDLPPDEAETFEQRLAADQPARDALAEAVRLSAAASGLPAPAPDPLVRRPAAERLRPTWLTALFPRRPYRGHPAAWLALGGVAAALVVAAVRPDPGPRLATATPEVQELVMPAPLGMSPVGTAVADATPAVHPFRPSVAVPAPLTDMRAESIVGPMAPPHIRSPMAGAVVPTPMTTPMPVSPRAEGPADPHPEPMNG